EAGRLSVVAAPGGRLLVVKPARGEGGDGVAILGPVDGVEGMRAAVVGRGGDLVIQAWAAPHPDLLDLSMNALPTVRIVTILNELGCPEPVSATFRCPADPEAQVDNMKAGGLIAPVDLQSGLLGVACLSYEDGDHADHPATGAGIRGRS